MTEEAKEIYLKKKRDVIDAQTEKSRGGRRGVRGGGWWIFAKRASDKINDVADITSVS